MIPRIFRAAAGLPLLLALAPMQSAPALADTAADPTTCLNAAPPAARAGDVTFGINPRATAGQVGAPAAALPEDASKQTAAVRDLAGGKPFVARLTRIMWPVTDPNQGAALDRDIAQYSRAGAGVELQLRYHPPAGSAGDPAGFAAWAASMVRTYSSNPSVVAVQVTNEVNASFSADSSDGSAPQALQALISGVEKASDEARADGGRIKVGFNWFYRSDPTTEAQFWNGLAAQGGSRLASATDWVGLDAYPGTFFPPTESGDGSFYGGMVSAMTTLRCMMQTPAMGATPIHVEEVGYPTDAGSRTPDIQVQALREMTKAAHDYAGALNVTDLRWFDLRDADSGSPSLQQHYGVMGSDYSRKPAYATLAQAIAQYGRAAAPAAGSTPAGSGSASGASATPYPPSAYTGQYGSPAYAGAGAFAGAAPAGAATTPTPGFNEGAGGVFGPDAAAGDEAPADAMVADDGSDAATAPARPTGARDTPQVPPLTIAHRVLRLDPKHVAAGVAALLGGLLVIALGVLLATRRRPAPAPPATGQVAAPVEKTPPAPVVAAAAVADHKPSPKRAAPVRARAARPAAATPRTRRVARPATAQPAKATRRRRAVG